MFKHIEAAAQDAILSLTVAFKEDLRPQKMDLGIGVYKDDSGHTPIMSAVKRAQQQLAQEQDSKVYVGMPGRESFNSAIQDMLFLGTEAHSRTAGVQTAGGSGGLRLLADLLAFAQPGSTVWMSDPSYVNHAPIMLAAGLKVAYYPYFDSATKQVNKEAMLECIARCGKQDIVLLHGCCHNPTGASMDIETWQQIAQLSERNGFTPFVDIAYQGFGDGIEQDAAGLRILADSVEEMVVVSSCSKNFGLYRERTGAAFMIGDTLQAASNAKSQLLTIARTTYTMPPDHGAALVDMILNTPSLRQEWERELNAMRGRIQDLRQQLSSELANGLGDNRFDFIKQHKGMFTMLGITPEQIDRLRYEHGIYMVRDSRINMAALQAQNVGRVAQAIKSVL